MENLEDLKAFLLLSGFTIDDVPRYKNTGVDWYAYRRYDKLPNCACNETEPSICVWPYELINDGKQWHSCELELTAATPGRKLQWFQLKAYGIGLEQLPEDLERIADEIGNAWKEINQEKSAGSHRPTKASYRQKGG